MSAILITTEFARHQKEKKGKLAYGKRFKSIILFNHCRYRKSVALRSSATLFLLVKKLFKEALFFAVVGVLKGFCEILKELFLLGVEVFGCFYNYGDYKVALFL